MRLHPLSFDTCKVTVSFSWSLNPKGQLIGRVFLLTWVVQLYYNHFLARRNDLQIIGIQILEFPQFVVLFDYDLTFALH